MTEQQVVDHLKSLADGDIKDITYRKSLIRLFVNKIFLYDDKFTITFNTGDEEVTITEVMLSEIEEELSGNSLCFLKNKVHQKSRMRKRSGFFFFLLHDSLFTNGRMAVMA